MRLVFFILALTLLLGLPFLLWEDAFNALFTGESLLRWLRQYEAWSAALIVLLLMADLLLPIPATPIMSAAGYLFGAVGGGLLSAAGSFAAGLLGYALCRRLGTRAAARLAGAEELARAEVFFRQRGAWLVAVSRCLPLMPEVISCLAGLTRMPLRTFMLALACGSLPVGFIYAAIGAQGRDYPTLALGASAVLPVLLFAVARAWQRRWAEPAVPPPSERQG